MATGSPVWEVQNRKKVNVRITIDYNTYSDEESSFCNLILPCFKCEHWLNACPDSFVYDRKDETRLLRHVKHSFFRKASSFLVQACVLVHILGMLKLFRIEAVGKVKTLFTVIIVTYFAFFLATSIPLLVQCGKIESILRSIQQLETKLVGMGCAIPKPKKAKALGWALVSLYVSIAIAFVCANRFRVGSWLGHGHGFSFFLEHLASTSVLEANLLFNLGLQYNATQAGAFLNAGVALPFVIVAFLYDVSWVLGYLLNLLWGIVFSWIFSTFYKMISTRERDTERALKDIRLFNEISSIIESFNDIFSPNIFSGVLAGSIHFSVYVLNFFEEDRQGGLILLTTALSFSLFWIQLFAAAHVNHMAQNIGAALKRSYQAASIRGDAITDGMCNETTQGMLLIFYELLAGKIGFQGLGFFTVTYSFVGTVVSAIATYSLVVMQFKSGDS